MKGGIRILVGMFIMFGSTGLTDLGPIIAVATVGALIMYSGVRALEKQYPFV
jgi:hypothetical protein